MGGVVVVVQFIRTSISLLVAAFGEPMAHGVPCLLKLVHSKFEMPDCILTARNRHFTDFAFYLHLFVDNDAGTLPDFVFIGDRRIVVCDGSGFSNIRRVQSPGCCSLSQFCVSLANQVERADVAAIGRLHFRHFFYFYN